MSRTYKDRPFWVKRNDRSLAGVENHCHAVWRVGQRGYHLVDCTINDKATRENSVWYQSRHSDIGEVLWCYWDPFENNICDACRRGTRGVAWFEGTRRSNERDSMLQYKKEYNSGERDLSFDDDVFSTKKRHDYDPWWCC